MTATTNLCLKFKIYLSKVAATTNNTLTQANTFISIYAFLHIDSILLQHLYLVFTDIHLRKLEDNRFKKYNYVDVNNYLN